jgi:hypothetical protein
MEKIIVFVLAVFGIIFLVSLLQSMPIWPDQMPRELIARPPLLNPPLPDPRPLFPLPIKQKITKEAALANMKETIAPRIGW